MDYQSLLNTLNGNTNSYYGQQQGFYQKDHDVKAQQYDTQNNLALGTQDQAAKDAFLSQIFNPLQKQQGSLEFGYGLDSGHENNTYGLNTTANTQNRKLALDKLANDEQYALAGLGLKQGDQNASTIDNLNSRGLLYGQQPTGEFRPDAMGGMNGVAGQQAGRVNQDFNTQRGQLTSGYGLNKLGTNLQYDQSQHLLDENHGYNANELKFNAANGINNQNMNFLSNTGANDNQLQQYKASINNQKQKELFGNEQNAKTQGAMQNGYALYK